MCQMPKKGIKTCLQHPSPLQQELCKEQCPLCASQLQKLLDFHGSSLSLTMVPPEEQEGRQMYRETCRDKQGAPGDIPALISGHFLLLRSLF